MEVLSILRDGPHRITELTELEGIAQPTMTLLVKRLEGRGWVRREGLPDDGRVVMITRTEEGSAAQQWLRAQFLTAMPTDLQALSDAELRAPSAGTERLGATVGERQQRAERCETSGRLC